MTRLLERPAAPPATPAVSARSTRRATHPLAWWGWAICAAMAASVTTNLLLLILICAAVTVVVIRRRSTAPWAQSFRVYFVLAGFIVVMRVSLQVLVGAFDSGPIVFTLPELQLPEWAAGIRLGGEASWGGLAFALTEAVRIATMIICVGAANALANPKRALRVFPAALADVSTALVIAVSVIPQLIESLGRVRRTRRLRGESAPSLRTIPALIVPIVEDALERSMSLAAGMEARGYGGTGDGRRVGRGVTALLLSGLFTVILGTFLLLGAIGPVSAVLAPLLIAASLAMVALALRQAGRRLAVTHYRPDRWGARESAVVAGGVLAFVLALWLTRAAPEVMQPEPGVWPPLHRLLGLVPLLLITPGFLTSPAPPGES
ncbi:MAG: CbiQ family ECF transporter T component [Candidatus Nanopelagicales bacterium]